MTWNTIWYGVGMLQLFKGSTAIKICRKTLSIYGRVANKKPIDFTRLLNLVNENQCRCYLDTAYRWLLMAKTSRQFAKTPVLLAPRSCFILQIQILKASYSTVGNRYFVINNTIFSCHLSNKHSMLCQLSAFITSSTDGSQLFGTDTVKII